VNTRGGAAGPWPATCGTRGTLLASSPRSRFPAASARSSPQSSGGGLQAAIVRALTAHIERLAGSEPGDELREQLGEEVRKLVARSESVCSSGAPRSNRRRKAVVASEQASLDTQPPHSARPCARTPHESAGGRGGDICATQLIRRTEKGCGLGRMSLTTGRRARRNSRGCDPRVDGTSVDSSRTSAAEPTVVYLPDRVWRGARALSERSGRQGERAPVVTPLAHRLDEPDPCASRDAEPGRVDDDHALVRRR
jgi:hypothetical protein